MSTNDSNSSNAGQRKKGRDFAAMDWVRDDLEGKLPDGEYGLMLYLALRADRDHACYPGIRLMATAFNRNPRTIMRRLDNLESWGLITKRRRRNTSTKYTLNVGALPGGDTGVASQPDTGVTSEYDNGYNTSSAVEEQQFEEGEIDEKANPTDLLLPPALDSDSSLGKEKKKKGGAAVPVQLIARWREAGEIVAKYEKNVLAHPNSRIGLYFALGRHFYPAARKFKAGKALTSGQLKQLHGLFDTYGDRACRLLAMMFVEWLDLIPKWSDKANPDFGMLDFDAMNKTLLARETPAAGIPPLKPIAKVGPPVQPKPLPKVPMTTGIEWMDELEEEAA